MPNIIVVGKTLGFAHSCLESIACPHVHVSIWAPISNLFLDQIDRGRANLPKSRLRGLHAGSIQPSGMCVRQLGKHRQVVKVRPHKFLFGGDHALYYQSLSQSMPSLFNLNKVNK